MSKRSSNIELLRILAIMGVIVLHYNNINMGGGFRFVPPGSVNYYLLHVLENLCICAVNLFLLISGYFLCGSYKRSLRKPLQLLIQVVLFSAGCYLLQVFLFHRTAFSWIDFRRSFVPANYFAILYIVLYLISPYLNLLIHQLSFRKLNQMMILFFLIFSVWASLTDLFQELTGIEWTGLSPVGAYGSQWGYTIVNFILLYLIGAYLKLASERNQSNPNRPSNTHNSAGTTPTQSPSNTHNSAGATPTQGYPADPAGSGRIKALPVPFLILLLAGCVGLLMLWIQMGNWLGHSTEWSAREYCNPIVIAEAVLLFLLFRQWDIPQNKYINALAKGGFSVFLFHGVLIPLLKIERFAAGNPLLLLLHVLGSCVGIYLISWVVYFVYEKITAPCYRLLERYIAIPTLNAKESPSSVPPVPDHQKEP